MTMIDDLISFLDESPSPWHAVRSTIHRLEGFTRIHETDAWDNLPSSGYVVRDGAIIAWRAPEGVTSSSPFRLVGAHTDSPVLRIKPQPDTHAAGFKQLGVEVYGGILNNTWLDRDLGIAGRIVDGNGDSKLVNVAEPIARVPQLAVHLDRDVNTKGLMLDRQQHLKPIWGIGASSPNEFASWIATKSGLDEPAQWWDLCLYDIQGAEIIGADRSLLASGRLDNLLSCWSATQALYSSMPINHTSLVVFNDHEEVGSASTTGAAGPFLESVLTRIVTASGGSGDDLQRAIAESSCISADNAHAVHPNYPERHDPDHGPIVNSGPALKVNANQRYATSAETAADFQRACEAADVPWQVFVSRNNMPCGSTIGPLTATRLGIPTADVGIAQLSMHSARELCGIDDPIYLSNALTSFLSG
jgi:aspartyl aminopeptidase